MKNFSEFLSESILDPEQVTLSPHVFDVDGEPKLKTEVRTQIIAGISKLSERVNVVDYTLIGSILTKRYAPDSDIDVNVLVNTKQSDIDDVRSLAVSLSGKTISGTKHPINYHVLADKSDFDNANESADGVFDISNNTLIRKPIDKPFHIEKYFGEFKNVVSKIDALKGELKDDLIDYSVLKTFSSDDATNLRKMIEKELDEIESDVKGLSALYDKIWKDRNAGFQKKLTPTEIREYGTKNRLPGNVIYKLLERHHYLEFLHQVEAIVADGKVSEKEADKLIDIVF
jgi:predicted nucleotidyltransferase